MQQTDGSPDSVCLELEKLLEGKTHLLIIVHNTPDPDAVASAAALSFAVEKKTGVQTSIAYGGSIGRAENREMIRRLCIKMKQIGKISLAKYDSLAVVDTQPGAGNAQLPPGLPVQIVIDHHPRREDLSAAYYRIEPDIGATSTLLVELLKECGIEPPADLATALAFGITTETQSLARETTGRDIDAYMYVYQKSNIRKLAQIITPKLSHSYFEVLSKTLIRARTYRNLICAHIGEIPNPESVSEMANFLIRHERIGWCLCTGHLKNRLVLSIRTSRSNAGANRLVKALVPRHDTVGGHDMTAGGYIPLAGGNNQEVMELEIRLLRDFASLLGYENVNWKPLMEKREPQQ
jgi:nanoRNase/pAp phosphatase (c-di-AMP/oligoRNAs hydrolase)